MFTFCPSTNYLKWSEIACIFAVVKMISRYFLSIKACGLTVSSCLNIYRFVVGKLFWSHLEYIYPHDLWVLLYSAFCFQSIAKNRKHWSSQNLDDNVLMVRILKSSFNRLRKCVNSVTLYLRAFELNDMNDMLISVIFLCVRVCPAAKANRWGGMEEILFRREGLSGHFILPHRRRTRASTGLQQGCKKKIKIQILQPFSQQCKI